MFVCNACGNENDDSAQRCGACYSPNPNLAQGVRSVKSASTSLAHAGTGGNDKVVSNSSDICVGIDPGARYTGVAVIDSSEVLLASWIFVRPELEKDYIIWSRELLRVLDTEVFARFPKAHIGIENVSDPKGFKGGSHSAMNPRDIMRTAQILGALSVHYPDAVYISPANNGSQSDDYYPDALKGRRPADLIGSNYKSGTRKHEKSAYDVAVKALQQKA